MDEIIDQDKPVELTTAALYQIANIATDFCEGAFSDFPQERIHEVYVPLIVRLLTIAAHTAVIEDRKVRKSFRELSFMTEYNLIEPTQSEPVRETMMSIFRRIEKHILIVEKKIDDLNVSTDTSKIEQLTKERDGWQQSAMIAGGQVHTLKSELTKMTEERDRLYWLNHGAALL